MNIKIFFLTLLILFSCTHKRDKYGELILPNTLQEAIASGFRFEENEERDKYQHPEETLDFFGVTPEKTVVEISPGAGFYTEILAPLLAKQGQYVIVVPRLPPRPPAIVIENEKKLQNILVSHREIQAKTKLIPFEPMNKRNSTKVAFADVVLTFNSVHNWVANDTADFSFKFFYSLLRPGGVLGVAQHRIAPGKKKVPKSGYMTEKEVITLAQKAGFKLIDKSEINANPRDTADYPGGVWTLPPFYRLGDMDKSKYRRIGESDRMTLKFVRPK